MRWILIFSLLFYVKGNAQYKDFKIGVKGDTLNATDKMGKKQGKWVIRVDEIRAKRDMKKKENLKTTGGKVPGESLPCREICLRLKITDGVLRTDSASISI